MADQNSSKYWIWMNRLVLFEIILDILDNESRKTTLRNNKWRNQYGEPKLLK